MGRIQIYIAGVIILLLGLAAGAYLLGLPPKWIGIGSLVVVGFGVIGAATHTRKTGVRIDNS